MDVNRENGNTFLMPNNILINTIVENIKNKLLLEQLDKLVQELTHLTTLPYTNSEEYQEYLQTYNLEEFITWFIDWARKLLSQYEKAVIKTANETDRQNVLKSSEASSTKQFKSVHAQTDLCNENSSTTFQTDQIQDNFSISNNPCDTPDLMVYSQDMNSKDDKFSLLDDSKENSTESSELHLGRIIWRFFEPHSNLAVSYNDLQSE